LQELDDLGLGPVTVMVDGATADEAAVTAVWLDVHRDVGIRANLITTIL